MAMRFGKCSSCGTEDDVFKKGRGPWLCALCMVLVAIKERQAEG